MLQAAAQRWDLSLSFEQMEWASCEYYAHHGKMMPDDWREQLQGFDAIYFGRRRLAGYRSRPHFAMGVAAEVPPRVRSIRQPAPGAPVPRCPLPAGG
ncbi:hypothetical protein LNP59_25440 [Klebsiella pneumoniae subsp. pneumoniae]|nr:hypothetical protein [Klebsiella pneumoniae subsp. pneumoniae]